MLPRKRIDFAVVRDVAIRMGAFPARKRIRAETRMDQRKRAFPCRHRADQENIDRPARA